MKSILSLLEPEEFVGGLWHGLMEKMASEPRYPAAATRLDDMRKPLGVLFHGLGGPAALRIASAGEVAETHRRPWRQRIAGEGRKTGVRRDGQAIYLPPVVDAFPDERLNRALYIWLTALFANLPTRAPSPATVDRDVAFLRDVKAATAATLEAAPGLAADHERLRAFALRARHVRRLPPAEAAVEQAVRALLGESEDAFDLACDRALQHRKAGYKTFAPTALWGEALTDSAGAAPAPADGAEGAAQPSDDECAHKGRRSAQEQTERRDYLALNRFEKLLTMSESMNLARPVEDDDPDGARKAAGDASEIVLSPHRKNAATRLKLELDLTPAAAQDGVAAEGLRYPEWDWKLRAYRPDYCRILVEPTDAQGAAWAPSPDLMRRVRRVRKHFEALRPRREFLRAQTDGDDLDMEAIIRAQADLAAGETPSDRMYITTQKQTRDLAVALLVDASLSTESWIGERQVIDIARESALLFCHALDAGGDANAAYAFTSRGRNNVRVASLKSFDDKFAAPVVSRIGALKPGYYTRIGAAVRHVAAELAKQPARNRLLLVLTDGKPNDIDHYEGRFGIEDTRRAIREARRGGARVFGITIDGRSQMFFPTLFGRGGYAVVNDPARLPGMMPALLKHVMAG